MLIVFYAVYSERFNDPNNCVSRWVYECAIRANMGVGEEVESGLSDYWYYNDASEYIIMQKILHNEEEYIN